MVTKKIQTEQTRQQFFLAGFQVLKEKGVKRLTTTQMFDTQVKQEQPKTLVGFLENSANTTLKMMDETPEFMIAIYYFIDFSRFNETYTIRLQNLVMNSSKEWVDDLSGYLPHNFPEERKEILVYMLDAFFTRLGTQYLILQDQELYLKISTEFINMIVNFIEGNQK